MTAIVYKIRDYQSKSAIERAHKALEEHLAHEANQIMNEALFGYPVAIPTDYDPSKHWPSNYRADEKDPA